MKKIGILFVTIIMALLFVVSASALEPTGKCGDDVYWSFDETSGELVISGEGDMYDYFFMTAPFYNSAIKSVYIGDGVTSIGELVFYRCESLTSVTIPDSVTSICRGAFAGCTSLTNITIPDSVTSIGAGVFYGCTGLKSITVDENNENYINNNDGVLFNKDKTKIVMYPAGNTRTTYIIPDSVISIGERAFGCCNNLTSITIPDSATSIGECAFEGCDNLTGITIGDSVTSIGEKAFQGCTSLTSITIPDSVTYIGDLAFDYCESLEYVHYTGTEDQWKEISIGSSSSESIGDPIIHYSYNPSTDYSTTIIQPTCTKKGYTIYTCECGYSYVDDYVGVKPHSYTSVVTKEPTHLAEGVKTFTCTCGAGYTDTIPKKPEHTYYVSKIIAPLCESVGYTTYSCACGDSYNGDYMPEKGHNYNGQMCKDCGEKCSCNCHEGGISGFFFKILNFFQKLFGQNKVCACGAKH